MPGGMKFRVAILPRVAGFLAMTLGAAATLHAQVVSFEPVIARPGQEITLTVLYSGEGRNGVAAQFEMELNDAMAIRVFGVERPRCQVAANLQRGGTGFAFVPAGCAAEVRGSCDAVRAVIFDFFDRTPFPDGPLVMCDAVVFSDTAEGTYPLRIRRVTVADSAGQLLSEARSEDGVLEVRLALPTPTPTATPLPTSTSTPPPALRCVGDCNHDDTVTIEEIVHMVAVAQGEIGLSCAAADPNGDGAVTIEEILLAVNFALSGC